MIAQCDVCGWSAPFAVARERARYEADEDREIGHNDDAERKQLPAEAGQGASGTRRRADRE